MFEKKRFSTSLEEVFAVIENDQRCIVQPMDLDVVSMLPTKLEIHDAIITATALLFKGNPYFEDVEIITKDEEILKSKLVKTIW